MSGHIFEYSEVLKLKAACAEHYPDHVHFHDGCGGQYFSLDEPNIGLQEFICGYIEELGFSAEFTGDGLVFTVKRAQK